MVYYRLRVSQLMNNKAVLNSLLNNAKNSDAFSDSFLNIKLEDVTIEEIWN